MHSAFFDTAKLQSYIEQVYTQALRDFGFSVLEAHILASLHEYGGAKATVLAQRVGRAATSFTPIIDTLENGGWIERRDHAIDRRAVLICLTEQGREIASRLHDTLAAVHASIVLAFAKRDDVPGDYLLKYAPDAPPVVRDAPRSITASAPTPNYNGSEGRI